MTHYKFIDLRSENEFKKGTIPESINIPILNNYEYEQVGVDYKNYGKQSAIKLANSLISGERKQNLIEYWIQIIHRYQIKSIFCKRGGLRSLTAKMWLRKKNISIKVLGGGYKGYRKKVIELHSKVDNYKGNWNILSGYTGSGKTSLIKRLSAAIDLEGIAKHRGSTFGATNKLQPSQQDFENILTNRYLKHPFQNLILENESRNIGAVALPGKFYEKMQSSNIVLLESQLHTRVNNIYEEYVLKPQVQGVEKSRLLQNYSKALIKIRNRLGGDNYLLIKNKLEMAFLNSNLDEKLWIQLLLEKYYDKFYKHKIDILEKNIIYRGDLDSCFKYLKSLM